MPDPAPNLLAFTPVPLQRHRARGWTPDAQHAFIATLAQCGIVSAAAQSVGRTPQSAYQLRKRPGADSFAAAWDWAIEMGLDAARDAVMRRIMGTQEEPLYRHGRRVGTRTVADHRLQFAALRAFAADVNGTRALMPHNRRIDAREMEAKMREPWPWDPLVPRPPEREATDADYAPPPPMPVAPKPPAPRPEPAIKLL